MFKDKEKPRLPSLIITTIIVAMLIMMSAPVNATYIGGSITRDPYYAIYYLGDTITYKLIVENPGPETNTVNAELELPDGSIVSVISGLVQGPYSSDTFYETYTVKQSDVDAGIAIARFTTEGTNEVGLYVEKIVEDRATIDEREVPFDVPEEFWTVEWFQTYPKQYTQFNLPDDQMYLTTLSWTSVESMINLWNGDPTGPISSWEGERVKFIHDPAERMDDIYFNEILWGFDSTPSLYDTVRVYGTFGEGPGAHEFVDPESGYKPENAPYTDPMGPFYPQSLQAPVKDHITFNPAIMDPRIDDVDEDYYDLLNFGINYEAQKVFKRMSYEKDLFKDHKTNGCFDAVFKRDSSELVICLEDMDAVHAALEEGYMILESNNRPTVNGGKADIYAPAIIQDFTYMFLDDIMPTPIRSGSKVLIPMASDSSGDGLDSFKPIHQPPYDIQKQPQALLVESEQTLGLDIDGDGVIEPMDPDGKPLSGDESVVFVLSNQRMKALGPKLQLFDHEVELMTMSTTTGTATFEIDDNEGDGYYGESTTFMHVGDVKYFYRAIEGGSATEKPAFYLKLQDVSYDNVLDINTATVEVGRMFGQTGANIAANEFHSQKAFWVDDVYYNIAAIKAYEDNMIKYITFREKLPKVEIAVHGHTFEVWSENEQLPEMAPFNMDHTVHEDVLNYQSRPQNMEDKLGTIKDASALDVRYYEEDIEDRFHGELKEIYNEQDGIESWMIEWFQTMPKQYTAFNIDQRFSGEKWLLTSAFYAPESNIQMWNGGADNGPMFTKIGERVKFWFDDSYEPLYIDNGELRVFGTYGKGPGDHDFIDPESGLKPENPPYTNPMGPFYPQSPQAPVKDHVTFNPAIMDPRDDDEGEEYYRLLDFGVNYEAQKVFKRMSYEKDWFKDHNTNGCFDVVLTSGQVKCIDDLELSTASIEESNNDPRNGDIYAPAIIQEFTYMFLDDIMPTPIRSGSKVLIPMASDSSGDGLDSFKPIHQPPYDIQKQPQALLVESEETLGLDIDGDDVIEPMDPDGIPLSGDESVVFVLRNQRMKALGPELQLFDHEVQLMTMSTTTGTATFEIDDNEGSGYYGESTVFMHVGNVTYFYRAKEGGSATEKPAFYLKLLDVSYDNALGINTATVEVGRMFGQTGANIAANEFHSQKAFWVDDVYYNIAAIRAYDDNMIKYITFREKLPKVEIAVHGHTFRAWTEADILPEMAPFNMPHTVHQDVQLEWTTPYNFEDKLGPTMNIGPLEINYTDETTESRYYGELKEIYWEIVETGEEEPEVTECELDMNGDNYVNALDIVWLLTNSQWGLNPGHVWDLNGDNYVNAQDVVYALVNQLWGVCPSP